MSCYTQSGRGGLHITYGLFLLLFIVPPLIVVLFLTRTYVRGHLAWVLAGIACLALLYTGWWDNLIIVNGVWSYGPGRVWNLFIGHVPLEEYLFYVLQVVLTGAITAFLLRRRGDL